MPLAVRTSLSQIVALLVVSRPMAILSNALGILTLLSVVLILLRRLFSVASADYETINATLCVYLLMGVLWAFAYSLVVLIAPASFSYPLAAEASNAMHLGGQHSLIPLYYSFVTMTTLGYGDIVPIGSVAKVLAIFQATLGQIYLVVIVARLVGLQVSNPSGESG